MIKRLPKTWQEKFENSILSGEYVPTPLSEKHWQELERKAKYYLKYGKYPKEFNEDS